jgi:hypothetical protein
MCDNHVVVPRIVPVYVVHRADPAAAIIVDVLNVFLGLLPGQIQPLHDRGDSLLRVLDGPDPHHVGYAGKNQVSGASVVNQALLLGALAKGGGDERPEAILLDGQPLVQGPAANNGHLHLSHRNAGTGGSVGQLLAGKAVISKLCGEFLGQLLAAGKGAS